MDSGALSASRSPSQSRSSHRMLYGLVTKGRAYRRAKAARHLNNVSLSKQRNVFCLSSSVFDGWFRTDGYGEGKTRHNETLGGWPERVSATS